MTEDTRALACALRARAGGLKPPPKLTLSEWANRYAYLSPETSAEPGKFTAFAYQIGLMDAVTDPTVSQVTVMKSARIGFTKILDHIIGYFIHQDPSPVLIVQPTIADGEDYSRTEIAPMLRDTPVLAALVGADIQSRDPNQRIVKRVFRNGASVAFIGANSPTGFRRITSRIVCFDEIDSYKFEGAGQEGDQITLGTKRSDTFWNRKIILGSTPVLKGSSRIEREWGESDQRRYFVPCPQCGHKQTLKFTNLRWDKDEDGKHKPETAHFVCEENGCVIEEHQKPWMIDNGEWIAAKPFTGHVGFHIWAAYSLFPNACWANLAADWVRVHKDPVLLKTFVNTTLGETWEGENERVDPGSIIARAENYSPETIPAAVRCLTAGGDVQGNRIEVAVIGWGDREESWAIEYEIFYGDPAQQQVWVEVDKFLATAYHNEAGRELRIKACCIDSGGNHTNQVIQFCNSRRGRNIYAIKGVGGPRLIWPKRASQTRTRETIFILGVDTAKDAIYGRLNFQKVGPGYIHFPVGDPFNDEYYSQLTVEYVRTIFPEGRAPFRKWFCPPGKRNEALDTMVYALAARMSFRLDQMLVPPPSHPSTSEPAALAPPPSPFPVFRAKRTSLATRLA